MDTKINFCARRNQEYLSLVSKDEFYALYSVAVLLLMEDLFRVDFLGDFAPVLSYSPLFYLE